MILHVESVGIVLKENGLKHYKDIHLGYSETATLDDTLIIYDLHTSKSHLPISDRVSYPLWETQFMCEIGLQNKPKKFCVLIPEQCKTEKVNEQNTNTQLDSVIWFLENIHPPSCGISFSVYLYEKNIWHLNLRYSAGCIWPLNKDRQWIGDGDYITVHSMEKTVIGNKWRGGEDPSHQRIIDNIEQYTDYNVKKINYADGEEKMFSLIKHAKFHVTYWGGMYYTAGMINCPTICYGMPQGTTNGNIKLPGNIIKRIFIPTTAYNSGMGNRPTMLHQYDWKEQKVKQGPQTFLTHANSPSELMELLNN
jgi:hypothetical protein